MKREFSPGQPPLVVEDTSPEQEGIEAGLQQLHAKEKSWMNRFRDMGRLPQAALLLFTLSTEGCIGSCGDKPQAQPAQESVEQKQEKKRKEEIEEFHKLLGKYSREGKFIKFQGMTTAISVESDSSGDGQISLEDMNNVMRIIEILSTQVSLDSSTVQRKYETPLEYLKQQEKKIALDRKHIDIPPYQLSVHHNEAVTTLELVNWISGEVIYTGNIQGLSSALEKISTQFAPSDGATEEEFTKKYSEEEAAVYKKYLLSVVTALKRDKTANLFKNYQALAAEMHFPENIYSSLFEVGSEGNGLEVCKDWLEKGLSISLTAIKQNRELNAMSGQEVLSLSFEDLKEYESGTVRVEGQITFIELRKASQVKPIYTDTIYRDKYNNLVQYTQKDIGDGYFIENFVIGIPHTSSQSVKENTISLDLERVGLGDYKDVFSQVRMAPLKNIVVENAHYRLYSSMQAEEIRENKKWEEELTHVAEGISTAETFFGIPPGEAVKNILIIDVNDENASFQRRDLATVVVTDDLLDRSNADYSKDDILKRVGVHETVHLVDELLGLADDEEVKTLYGTLELQFLGKLNESGWFRNGFGGHAQDNVKEMIASLMNGLESSFWILGVEKLTLEQKKIYLDVLRTFKNVLEQKMIEKKFANGDVEKIKSFPVFKKIDEVLDLFSYIEHK